MAFETKIGTRKIPSGMTDQNINELAFETGFENASTLLEFLSAQMASLHYN
jgi:hypothetical protein